MEKRYQVFVSSTYSDLKDERQAVMHALMQLDCIPAGMELFPAADEEQLQFIKKIIDDSDYYILIIGGRYGSITSEGLSYTEQEYDYARGRDLKILSFIHEKPEELPLKNSERDPALRERLAAFRKKAETGTIVKFWNDVRDLPGLVALSLPKTIKTYPALGWVRADQASNPELLVDINQLRKANDSLSRQNSALMARMQAPMPLIEDIAGLQEKFLLIGTHYSQYEIRTWRLEKSWQDIFAALAPKLLESPNDALMHAYFETVVREMCLESSTRSSYNKFTVNESCYQTVKIQLTALKLVETELRDTMSGSVALFWSLTTSGKARLFEFRTKKTSLSA